MPFWSRWLTPAPNAICPLCFGLTHLPDTTLTPCPVCESESAAVSYYEPLDAFLQTLTLPLIDEMIAGCQQDLSALRSQRGRVASARRFYIRDRMKSLRRVRRLRSGLATDQDSTDDEE